MDWHQLINNFGVPVAVMIVLFLSMGIFCKWMAKQVIEPLVKSHVGFVDRVATSTENTAEVQKVIANDLKELARKVA